MKRLAMTIALACALSGRAVAGDIPSVGFTAPVADELPTPAALGDIPTVGFTQQVTETALTIIQLALGGVV